jgi:predicted small lipoprotein YifL
MRAALAAFLAAVIVVTLAAGGERGPAGTAAAEPESPWTPGDDTGDEARHPGAAP